MDFTWDSPTPDVGVGQARKTNGAKKGADAMKKHAVKKKCKVQCDVMETIKTNKKSTGATKNKAARIGTEKIEIAKVSRAKTSAEKMNADAEIVAAALTVTKRFSGRAFCSIIVLSLCTFGRLGTGRAWRAMEQVKTLSVVLLD